MTAETDLLPLPEPDVGMPGQIAFIRSDKLLQEWCRANVEHHTAAQAAEIEELRAEVERLQRQLRQAHKDYGCELRDPNGTIWEYAAAQKARAERLAEALRGAKEAMLSQVKWEACACGCPQGRNPADAVSVTWLRAVQQVEIATACAEDET